MFKYLCLFFMLTLLKGNSDAAPAQNIIQNYIEDFISKYVSDLDKYKVEIQEILSEILDHKDSHATINQEYQLAKQQMVMANDLGDQCAAQVLVLMDDKNITCPSLDELVQAAGDIVTSTSTIVTGTIHSFYLVFAENTVCEKAGLEGFRCFLAKFTELRGTVSDVFTKLVNYEANAGDLIKIYENYFGTCKKVKEAMKKHLEMYAKCNESKSN